jgi:alpha-ketoglutarate-dependent taurine dioxygenase
MFKLLEPAAGRNYAAILSPTDGGPLAALNPRAVEAAFRRYGALLFRGFRLELDEFSAFTRQFCGRFVRNESGRRAQVSADGTTQTVNIGRQGFPLHPELSRVPWRPDVAWFACASPPGSGGETVLCDGVAIAAGLSPQTREAVENRGLLYREETPLAAFVELLGVDNPSPALLERLSETAPFRFERHGDRIFRSFRRPFLHRPLFTDDLAFGNFLLFARYMLNARGYPTFDDGTMIPDALCDEIRRVAEPLTVAHRWQAGDILMVDNSRFMHGRNEVTDLEERVIWTQFGYARFAPPERVAGEPWRVADDPRAAFFGPDAADAVAGTRRLRSVARPAG